MKIELGIPSSTRTFDEDHPRCHQRSLLLSLARNYLLSIPSKKPSKTPSKKPSAKSSKKPFKIPSKIPSAKPSSKRGDREERVSKKNLQARVLRTEKE
jgi:hypothetical protein